MKKRADAIVIGAGSTGCSIAFHLARCGQKVVLMDRGPIASGPTGRSVAIIRQHYANSAVSNVARTCAPFFRNWRDQVDGDCGFIRTGFLTAVAERDVEALKANIEEQQRLGVEVEFVSIEEMRNEHPDMVSRGLGAGVYEANAGYCDPKAASLGLADGVRRHGGEVLEGCTVYAILVDRGAVCGVDTSEGRVKAPIVVNAAGPWAAALAATTGTLLPIKASRHCIALIEAAQQTCLATLPAYTELLNRFYLRPASGATYIVGSLDSSDSTLVEPDRCIEFAPPDCVTSHAARAKQRFRRLTDARVIESWASMFDDTPDGNPIVGPDPTISGSFIAAGLSGHGFKLCPAIGEGLADLITRGATQVPIHIFAVDRFSKRQPLVAKHPYLGGQTNPAN